VAAKRKPRKKGRNETVKELFEKSPTLKVEDKEMRARVQAADFPLEVIGKRCKDEPHMLEVDMGKWQQRVFGANRLVFPAGFGTELGQVVYELDHEKRDGSVVYRKFDPKQKRAISTGQRVGA